MKNTRRWLAGILAVVMVLNSSFGSVWAAETNTISQQSQVQDAKLFSEDDESSSESEKEQNLDESTQKAEDSQVENNSNATGDLEDKNIIAEPTEESQKKITEEPQEASEVITEEAHEETTEEITKENEEEPQEEIPEETAGIENSQIDTLSNDELDETVVYVGKEHGIKSESDVMGKSPEHPYATLRDAYASVPENGTIYVVDSLELSSWPDAEKNVTITGYQGNVQVPIYNENNEVTGYENKTYSPKLTMTGDWVLHGDVVLCNLTIQITKAPSNAIFAIFPEGHRLQIGTGNNDDESSSENGSGIQPKTNDTVIVPYSQSTDKEGFLNVATEPYNEEVDGSITKIDLHLYGDNRYNVMSCAKAMGTGANEYHTGDTLTPNLETVEIEMIGSSKARMMQKGNHWYNGMLPAFSGEKLKNVDFTLAYMSVSSTEALFRTGHDRNAKSLRKGNFSVKYSFDHVTISRNVEAIAYGETYTTGDVTLNLYDTNIIGSQSCLAPGVFGMEAGKITVNLYDTTLNRTGVMWNTTMGRNGNLQFDSMSYDLYGSSKITEYMILQDHTTLSVHDQTVVENIRYFPQTTTGTNENNFLKLVCDAENMKLPGSDVPQNGCVNLTVNPGKTVTIPEKNSSLHDVTNNGILNIEKSVTFGGDYTAANGQMNLTAGAGLLIKGNVSGNTTLNYIGEMEDGEITSVSSATGNSSGMQWITSLENTVVTDSYWSIQKGADHAVTDCIYLRYGGSDSLDGTSVQKAVGTIAKAYELATAQKPYKKIILANSYRVGLDNLSQFGANNTNNDQVIFTSDDGEKNFYESNHAELISTSTYTLSISNTVPVAPQYGLELTSAFQFENIHFAPSVEDGVYSIYCDGHPTVMGDNVTVDGYASLFGGSYAPYVADKKCTTTNLVVNSGRYVALFGGNAGHGKSLKSVSMTVNGCEMVKYQTNGAGKYYTAIIGGGCYTPNNSFYLGDAEQPCDVNLKVSPEGERTITGLKYILGGNVSGYTYSVGETILHGNLHLEVQGVEVEAIAGCDYNTRPTVSNGSQYTTEIEIGTKAPVAVQNLYAGSMGYTGGKSWNQEDDDSRLKNLKMTLGDVEIKQNLYGSDMVGTVVGHEVSDLTVLSEKTVEITGNITDFKNIDVQSKGLLVISGTMLGTNNLKNGGSIQLNGAEIELTGNYTAENDASLQMGASSKLQIKGTVTGNTTISGQNQKSFYIYATTDKVQNGDKEHSFVGENIAYEIEDTLSKWYFDPFNNSNLSFVYLDGTNGDDTYNGQSPQKGQTVTGDEGQSYTEGPVKTLEHAYELLKKEGGAIILCGDTIISQWPNNSNKKALLTCDAALVPEAKNTESYYNKVRLHFVPEVNASRFMVLQQELILKKILIDYSFPNSDDAGGMDANGYPLTIGEEEYQNSVSFVNTQTQINQDKYFIITGGGTARTNLDSIELNLYNEKIGTLAAIYGTNSSGNATTVTGNVNVTVKDCSYYSEISQFFCANAEWVKANYSNVCYAKTEGTVNLLAVGTKESPYQFTGFKNTTNEGSLVTKYQNLSDNTRTFSYSYNDAMQFPTFNTKTEITFEGKYVISPMYLANPGQWMGKDSDVTVNLFGDINIVGDKINSIGGNTGVNLTLNMGKPDQTYTIKSSPDNSLFPDSNQYFKSITVNCYGDKISVPFTTTGKLCVDGSKPVINYYPAEGSEGNFDIDACKKWKNVTVSVNDGVTINQIEEEEELPFDLTLKNGGKFNYLYDSMNLKGNLFIDGEESSLETDGAYTISGNVTLKNRAILKSDTELTVEGQLDGADGELLIGPGSNTIFGSVSETTNCKVAYNGTLKESKSHGGAQIKSVTDTESNKFSDAATSDGQTIQKAFDNNTWTYGNIEITNEIYLRSAGNDENDGTTSGKSVQTLKHALEIAANNAEKQDGSKKQTIVLCGRYDFGNNDENQIDTALQEKLKDVQITITQRSDNGTTYRGRITVESGYDIPCSLVVRKCVLNFVTKSQNSPELYANGYPLTIDEGAEIRSNGKLPVLYGGAKDGNCDSTQLDIYAGSWCKVYGGGKNGNVTGNVSINLGNIEKKVAPVISSGKEDDNFTGETYAVFGGGEKGNVGGDTTVNLNYGDEYNYVFGGGNEGDVKGDTNLRINSTITASRLYGGGVTGNVAGKATVVVPQGSFQRIYGAGVMESSSVGSTNVIIGSDAPDASDEKAIVERYVRGSGDRGKVVNEAILTIQKGAEIPERCSLAAGGYMGGAAKSVLNILGGTIACDSFAGGYGEYRTGSTTEINTSVGYVSASQLMISGGTITGNIFAGGNRGYVGTGEEQDQVLSEVSVTGGTITGNLYGGCNIATTYGNTQLTLSGGTIAGNVFGGGKGTGTIAAEVKGKSTINVKSAAVSENIYGGCDTNGTVTDTEITVTELPECNIFGGGYGEKTSVSGIAKLVLNAVATKKQENTDKQGNLYCVYGGGEKGIVTKTVIQAENYTGNIFGGGKGELKSTNRLARAFYSIFTDSDLIDANVPSTNVTINGTVNGDVFAGGEYATVGTTDTNATSETLEQAVSCITINGTINGKVYGGGKGEKGKEYAAVNGSTKVTLGTGGNVVVSGNKEDAANGIVFGGGQNAPVAGNTTVEVQDGTYSTVFGGNDVSGTIQGAAKVTVTGGRTEHVYGAGRDAAYEGTGVSVEINASKQGIDSAANTENATNAANVGNTANTENAENTKDTQNAQNTQNTQNTSSAEHTASEVYGGGYGESARTNKASVTIRNGQVTTAYAGGNAASTESAEISVTGGAVDTVFGGGNAATITGTSKITVNTTDETQHVETIFAGNNQAAMAIKPTLDLQDGKIGTLYCGGNQGVMTYHGDANQEIQYSFVYPKAEIDTVYAGCNNTTDMTSDVELTLVSGTYGTVYGGNNQNGAMDQTSVIVDVSADTTDAAADLSKNTGDAGSLQVTTIYGGGNQADAKNTNVTVKNGRVTTIYGGGNQALAENAAVNVENGEIDAVYGGGNAATVAESVTITTGTNENGADATESSTENGTSQGSLTIGDLYCGNNKAEMAIAPAIYLQKGTITNFYGGGNKGTMTCEQGISYTFDSADLTVDTMYGGGNEAGVTTKTALLVKAGNYTTIYGGSNSKGNVEKTEVTIAGDVGKTGGAGTLSGKIFGGGRGAETTVGTANVNLQNGKIAGNVYGGSGFGTVKTANVTVKESTENSGSDNTLNDSFGSNSDNTSNSNSNRAKVQIAGNVFGAGYGVSSSVEKTNVTVDLNLSIAAEENGDGDVQVTETAKSAEDKSGESLAKAEWKNNKKYTDGSYIAGNVFGGGDMGQVGKGYINNSTNTAVIEQSGTTSVTVSGGYIHGNVFGGGNGQPGGTDENGTAITEYTVYMGTVFGTSSVIVNGGYVNGSVFGCGQQSRTYAAKDQNGDGAKDASFVLLTADGNLAVDGNTATNGDTAAEAESMTQKPVLIGGSIFGGGNKGNGAVQNASVATTYGDTHVTLRGKEKQNTPIYLLSNANGTAGGGVYGDGNLCLVSGRKYVTLQNFSCGVGENVSLLKTFYSLQRADVVDLTGSRIVLKGAVDLVAENADDTLYSINRVSQLNLKQNSTIKVTKTVNLLGELTSDEQPDRQFIDRGNNTGNASITGNEYMASGGSTPGRPLTREEVDNYISAYNKYAENGTQNSTYQSINVVCVANGGYLEIKKSAAEYGPVTGLFTLQLVNANPGEGGGFVYADIMGKKMSGSDGQEKYITGNFICVTKQAENSNDYMYAYHNVGGRVAADGRYEYYVWYLKGNKYNYDVDLTAYIGTKDTDFTKNISLALEPNQVFILTELNQSKNVNGVTLETMYQNTWDASSDTDKTSDKFAVEVTLLKNEKSSTGSAGLTSTETSIGYLGYQTTSDTDPRAAAKKDSSDKLVWGIWRKTGTGSDGWKFQACKGSNNSFQVATGDDLAEIGTDVVSAQLKFALHKGTGMTTEFKNLPFEMKLVEVRKQQYDGAVNSESSSIETDSCIRLNTNLNLSAIRLVPTQAAYIGSGRMFAGVSSSSNVNITETSAFTAQFVTKYIPSAFNTGTESKITETLVIGYDDIYLLDPNGVGYTIREEADGNITVLNLTNTSNPEVKKYQITKTADGGYQVSYLSYDTLSDETQNTVMKDVNGNDMVYPCKVTRKSSGFTLPKGTMITLLASLDENDPTYWYYYCTDKKTEVSLGDFRKMNTSNQDASSGNAAGENTDSKNTSGENTVNGNSANRSGTAQNQESVYDTIFTNSSSRVTENMIFVFDFSEVAANDWQEVSQAAGQNQPEGTVMLRHTYEGAVYKADIMDYVSAESQIGQEGAATVTYTRETPKQTEPFKISKDSDGIAQFTVTNGDSNTTYGQRDRMKFNLNIEPDTTVTNTQYEEREYAVILTLRKKGTSGTEGETTGETTEAIPFPEGTIFTFRGKKLVAGKDNRYVTVPVETVGMHEVEIESGLYGFDPGEYELEAKLYSTTEEGYFNSIPVSNNTQDKTSAAFTIQADPVYALGVTEESGTNSGENTQKEKRVKNHLIQAGKSFQFAVKATGGEETDPVSVKLYQYEKSSGAYQTITLEQVFVQEPNLTTTGEGASQQWTPEITANAPNGTYRLEFTYHNKTEYWDFIITG